MKAQELHSHMQAVGTWVDWSRSSDKFLAGDAARRTSDAARPPDGLADAGTLRELAAHILAKVKPLGQDAVHMVGDPDAKVSRLALGTGAITNYAVMRDMGADVLLLTDDGTRLWESAPWSLDSGVPLLLVNHATAEEPGMMSLAGYLAKQFPKTPVKHMPVGCLYRTVHGA